MLLLFVKWTGGGSWGAGGGGGGPCCKGMDGGATTVGGRVVSCCDCGAGWTDGGGTLNLCGRRGGGWSGTSVGLGLRLGEQVELVDIGLYCPERDEAPDLAETTDDPHEEEELELDEVDQELPFPPVVEEAELQVPDCDPG